MLATNVRSGGPSSYGLSRDIGLLEALTSEEAEIRGGLGVIRVAEIVGREKSQVSRALRSLAEAGLVERDPETRQYRIGWRLFTLLARTSETRLLNVAPRYMSELVDRLDETVHLCTLQETEVLTLVSESPQHGFRGAGWVGRTVPAYCTSAGRVLLIDEERAAIEHRFSQSSFETKGPRLLVESVDALWTEVSKARAQGYALVDEEFENNLVGASSPVRNANGRIIAALNVSARKTRLGPRLESAGKETAIVAGELSEALGWRVGAPKMELPS